MSKETEKLFKEFHKYLEKHSDDNRTKADELPQSEDLLADRSAKKTDEGAMLIWQMHLPNSESFPLKDFLQI